MSDTDSATLGLGEWDELFARAFLLNPIPMTITNGETQRLTAANERFFQLTGYWRSDVIGQTSESLQLWPDRNERAPIGEALQSAGVAGPFNSGIRTKDGAVVPCAISFRLLEISGRPMVLSVLVPGH